MTTHRYKRVRVKTHYGMPRVTHIKPSHMCGCVTFVERENVSVVGLEVNIGQSIYMLKA